jgi:hypothetical protein
MSAKVHSGTAQGSAKRRKAARPLGDLVLEGLDAATRERGFAGAELLARWPEIAGGALAGKTRPIALRWPPRGPKTEAGAAGSATLEIAVSPALALDLQYAAPQLIERINALFGWACVGRLKIAQRAIEPPPPKTRPRPPLPLADQQRLEQQLRKIEDPELRDALFRLGDGVIRRKNGT